MKCNSKPVTDLEMFRFIKKVLLRGFLTSLKITDIHISSHVQYSQHNVGKSRLWIISLYFSMSLNPSADLMKIDARSKSSISSCVNNVTS